MPTSSFSSSCNASTIYILMCISPSSIFQGLLLFILKMIMMLQILCVDLTIYLLVMTGEGFRWSGLGVNVVGTEMGQGRQ